MDLGEKDSIVEIKVGPRSYEFSYRQPTASELQTYYTSSFVRRAHKNESNVVGARVNLAMTILTGFRNGDFSVDGKPISSDPSHANYCADWRALLSKKAILLLDAFIVMTVDTNRFTSSGEDEEIPLPKSSDGLEKTAPLS